MFYTIFVFLFGVYVGQEYNVLTIRQLIAKAGSLVEKNDNLKVNENFGNSELFSSFIKTFWTKKENK